MGADGPLDVLQHLRPNIVEAEVDTIADMLAHRFRDQHAAGLAQLLQACSHVDPIAENVGPVGDHVAEVDTDPQREAPFRRDRRLAVGNRLLQRDRAQDGVDHRSELDQGPVASRLHEPAMMSGQYRIDDVAAQVLERADRSHLVLLDEPRVADHIGAENGSQAAIDPRLSQRDPPL